MNNPTITQGAETLGVESFGGTLPLDGGEGLAKSRGFAPGTVINGRYTVLRTLGRGGMGHVYDVTDAVNPERAVALKVISALGASPAKVSLFKAEFRTMTKLEHPNVARVYDLESVQGNNDFLITMERIDGEPLRDTIEPGDAKAAVDALVGVCRALSYVHSRQIVHFDLKPDNVLVCKNGAVKVVDFGISGGEPSKHEGHLLGTPLYMAPEMLLGNQQADHRADLYALGIAFYEVLTGRPPLKSVDAMSISAWLMNGGLKAVADPLVPEWLAPILERLSALDPSDRYRSANAVIEAINAAGPVRYELETEDTKQSYLLSSRFSGRDAELQRAVSFMNARLSGETSEPLLIVSGVSGIGKSRLMREVRYQAQLQRTPFLEANCHERSLVEYGPIAELLVQLVPMVEALGGVAEVADALPQLVKIAPVLGKGRTVPSAQRADSAETERVRFLETTSEFFVRAAARVGFVLYVNDLQWAGRGPVALLSHLVQRVRDEERQGRSVRLGIMLSHRADEVSGRPLEQLLQLTERQALAQKILLEPLAVRHVADLILSMLGIKTVPPEFMERVADETKGNPYFVQEVMRSLLENGTVFLDGDRWATKETVGEMRIPSSIAEVFRRRFSLLDEAEKDVARILSVHARPMRLELLAQILGGGQTAVSVRGLEERRIVERASGSAPTYTLAHDRMRETIYADLRDEERSTCHRRIAQELETATAALPEKDRPLDELAGHYLAAGVSEKALHYSLSAADRAFASSANDAAVEHYKNALTVMTQDGVAIPFTVHERYATSLAAVGRFSESDKQLHVMRNLPGIDQETILAIDRRLAESRYRQQDYANALEPLDAMLASLNVRIPPASLVGKLRTIPGMLMLILAPYIPRLIKKDKAKNPQREAEILRTLAVHIECGVFVSWEMSLRTLSVFIPRLMRRGAHPFSRVGYAMLSYVTSGRGLIGLSRRYERLSASVSPGIHKENTERSTAAFASKSYLMLLFNKMYRGELGDDHHDAFAAICRSLLKSSDASQDLQEQWQALITLSSAGRITGRISLGYAAFDEALNVARARGLSRLEKIQGDYASIYWNLLSGSVAVPAPPPDFASRLDRLLVQSFRALTTSLSSPSELFVALASDVADEWMRHRMSNPNYTALACSLAAIAMHHLQSRQPISAERLRLIQRARGQCMRERFQTGIYLSALATAAKCEGKHRECLNLFAEAVTRVCEEGYIGFQLQIVLQIARRVLDADSAAQSYYAEWQETLSQHLSTQPRVTLREVREQVPLPPHSGRPRGPLPC